MRLMVLGVKGFPGVEGGIETHAENLYPLLSQLGCAVEVVVRLPYNREQSIREWRGVRVLNTWAPSINIKGLETVIHSLLAVCIAGIKRPQLLHIHGVGPSLMVPLARLFGLRVVVTHHGPDYESCKWNPFARLLLKIGEFLGMRFAHQRIAVSNVVKEIISGKHRCNSVVVANGVRVGELPSSQAALHRFNLSPRRYVLMVSRFVSHKRHQDLILAFQSSGLLGWKLVLVGKLDSRDKYTRSVLSIAENFENVVFTGYQSGSALAELYANAGVFVLPSSYEGLPIAILEALSYGLPTLASNIPAHLEIGLPSEQYFPLGNTKKLSERLREFSSLAFDEEKRHQLRHWLKERYNWEKIAEQTLAVYRRTSRFG